MSTQTLSGFFKEIYDPMVKDLTPEFFKMGKLAKFVEQAKIGDVYKKGVVLTNEMGVTFAAGNSGAYALNSARGLTASSASISAFSTSLLSDIATQDAKRAATSKQAFKSVVGMVVENNVKTQRKLLEMECLYGSSGYADYITSTNTNVTTTVITIPVASWSDFWGGTEGMQVDVGKSGVMLNTSDAMTISKVDFVNRKLTITGANADITAIDAATGTKVIFPHGAYGNEMVGLDYAITTSGTVWGINNANFSMWKGNTYTPNPTKLTMTTLLASLAQSIGKGLDEPATCFINQANWSLLNTDQAALRMYPTEKNKWSNGGEAITFYSSNGAIDVVPHPYVKIGDGFIFPTKSVSRIGSTDISFLQGGGGSAEESYFTQYSTKEGMFMKSFSDQAFFLEDPAKSVKLTGLTLT